MFRISGDWPGEMFSSQFELLATIANMAPFSSFIPNSVFEQLLRARHRVGDGAAGITMVSSVLHVTVHSAICSLHRVLIEGSWLHVRINASLLSDPQGTLLRHCCCCWGTTTGCFIFNCWPWVISEINWSAEWRNMVNRLGINQWRKPCTVSYTPGINCVTAHSGRLEIAKNSLLARGHQQGKSLAFIPYPYLYPISH